MNLPSPETTSLLGAPDSQSFLAAVLETAVEGIVLIDDQGKVISFNHTAARMFGYPPEEVIGKNVSLLMTSPHQEQHTGYIQKYLRTGKARIIGIGREVTGLRKDGEQFPMELSVSEIKARKGHYFVGMIRDISDRKYLEQALVLASENERRLLGQELHDVLGQQITGLSLLAKSLEKKLLAAGSFLAVEAAELSQLAAEASAEAKRLAHGAYPTELERHGLQAALHELAENTGKLYNLPCAFLSRIKLPAMNRTAELNLYRIAQESVMNSVKHGQASRIDLSLEALGPDLVLTVQDDGVGISPSARASSPGMGLDIMRYRAGLINGSLTIRKRRRGGTEVRCCLHDWFRV
ncbi:MAG TPA: PAS domain S-box protein [Kiritimatiellia bacterium]|nr:PAS domain S-box protein [Kiritimatiellia bacterium]